MRDGRLKPYSKSRKMVPDQEMKVRSKWANRWLGRRLAEHRATPMMQEQSENPLFNDSRHVTRYQITDYGERHVTHSVRHPCIFDKQVPPIPWSDVSIKTLDLVSLS